MPLLKIEQEACGQVARCHRFPLSKSHSLLILTVSITITDATPTLYYVCKWHAVMGRDSNVSEPTNTLLTWKNNTILIEDNTHFDTNHDVEFSAINMACTAFSF